MKVSEIQPYKDNAKKHPVAQLKQIAKSIKEFGWQQAIVVDKKGVIIVGHGRFFAYEQYKDSYSLPEPVIKRIATTHRDTIRIINAFVNIFPVSYIVDFNDAVVGFDFIYNTKTLCPE